MSRTAGKRQPGAPDFAVVAHCRKSLGGGRVKESPFAEVTHGTKFAIRFDRKVPYELDGGARPARPC